MLRPSRLVVLVAAAVSVVGLVSVAAPATAAPKAAVPAAVSGGLFVANDPVRLMDTRSGLGGAGSVPPGETVTVAFAGKAPVAAGASALTYRLTVVSPSQAGSVSAYPGGTAFTGLVTLNFPAGSSASVIATTQLGSAGNLTFRNNSKAKVNLVVDVLGFYTGGAASTGGAYTAIPGTRIFDSRGGSSVRSGTTIIAAGRYGLPADIDALVANVTVVSPTKAGSLSLSPNGFDGLVDSYYGVGGPQQSVQTIALNALGAFTIRNNGTTDVPVVVDVLGYYRSGVATMTGAFTPIATDRTWDSRQTQSHAPISGSVLVGVPGALDPFVPRTGVSALVANLTAIKPAATESASLSSADGSANGLVAVNFTKALTTSTSTPVKLAVDQSFRLQSNGTVGVDYVLDLQGWFFGEPAPMAVSSAASVEQYRGSLNSVSCPALDFCMAVMSSGFVMTYDGTSWSEPAAIPGVTSAESVACTSAAFCAVVGANESSVVPYNARGSLETWNGTTWSTPVPEADQDRVACFAATACVTVSRKATQSSWRWDGTSWHPIYGPSNAVTLACSTASQFCLATDGANSYSFEAGLWGHQRALPSGAQPTALACTSSGICKLASGNGNVYSYARAAWTTEYIGTGAVLAASCWSNTGCRAVGPGVELSWDGASWTAATAAVPALSDVTCAAADFCVGRPQFSNYNARIYLRTGSGWGSATDLTWGQGTLEAVACPSVSFCVATDGGGGAVTWDGSTWGEPVLIDSNRAGIAVLSCPSPSFCAADDSKGGVITFDGTAWSAPSQVAVFTRMSCASSSFCAAFTGDGHTWVYDGTNWQDAGKNAVAGLRTLSCPSAGFCLSNGDQTGAWTFNGQTWKAAPAGSEVMSPTATSCSSVTFCLTASDSVIGGDPAYRAVSGAVWNGATQSVLPAPGGEHFADVSCPAANRCFGITEYSNKFVGYDGVGWSASVYTADQLSAYYRLSCASPELCVAIAGSYATVLRSSTSPAGVTQ